MEDDSVIFLNEINNNDNINIIKIKSPPKLSKIQRRNSTKFTIKKILKHKQINLPSGKKSNKNDKRLKFNLQFTIWPHINEFKIVYHCIYDSIEFTPYDLENLRNNIDNNDNNNGNEQIFNNQKFTFNNAKSKESILKSLQLANKFICVWKQRCSNLPNRSFQSILHHLKSIESMVTILIEEFKLEYMIQNNENNDTVNNTSLLYNLYSIGVINFCSVLESYSNETESIRNMAKNLQCPYWIVQCRHDSAHPTLNSPSIITLRNAITFGLQWMHKYFWSTNLMGEFQSNPISSFNHTNKNERNGLTLMDERDKIYRLCLDIIMTPRSELRNVANMKTMITCFMIENSNTLIDMIVQIMIVDVTKSIIEKDTDYQTFGLLMLRRFSRLFKLIFSNECEHILILMLNLIIDTIKFEQQQQQQIIWMDDFMLKKIEIGSLWLEKIFEMMILPNEQRHTSFELSFQSLPDAKRLLNENLFTWYRLFYKLIKLIPNKILMNATKLFYEKFLIHDEQIQLIPKTKYEKIMKLMELSIINDNCNNDGQIINSNHELISNIKTVEDLIVKIDPNNLKKNKNSSIDWNLVFIGAKC